MTSLHSLIISLLNIFDEVNVINLIALHDFPINTFK